jgi:MYXO-CTERM domain-containing protein
LLLSLISRALVSAATGVLFLLAPTMALAGTITVGAYASHCIRCHGAPPGTGFDPMPNLGEPVRLESNSKLRDFLKGFTKSPTMQSLGASLGESDLTSIREYLLKVRNGDVQLNHTATTSLTGSHTFGGKVYASEASTETLTITISNARSAPITSITLTGGVGPSLPFRISSQTCNVQLAAAIAPGTNAPECEIHVNFVPPAGSADNFVVTGVGQLTLTYGGAQLPKTVTHQITLSGTSAGARKLPGPQFAAIGFESLTTLSGSPAGGSTLCPTIQNTGDSNLLLSVSTVQAAGTAANYSDSFEVGDIAACPGAPRACLDSVTAGSPISGDNTLSPLPGGLSCTLPVRLNSSRFGADTAARSALLEITHNAPGSVFRQIMTGSVSAVPQPRIGLFTNPAIVGDKVLPSAFAAQVIGGSSTPWNEFFVFNSGSADGLDITEVTQTNATEFTLTENCQSALPLARTTSASGPHCTITLRFTPTATGERCTAVTVRAAVSSNGAQTLNVCGTGVGVPAAAMTLSRVSIDFGRRAVNASYPAEQLVIGNAAGASAALQVNAVTVIGTGFTLVPAATCSGASVAAGSNCTVQVQFSPDPARPDASYSASLQIDTNDPATPRRTVSLVAVAGGLATPPVLQFTGAPAQLEFTGFVVVGRQSDQVLNVTLRNSGPGSAAIQAVRVVGEDASSFSASGCQEDLVEGASCAISVRFMPGSGGVKRAQLEVVSSQSVTPALLTVTGQGIGATGAFITASAGSLSLGTVRVGAQSVPIELRLASAGDGAVRITAMEAGAPFTVQSKTCPGVPFTLPQGGDCTVTVTFTPTDAHAANAELRISTDVDSRALVVPLSANGEANADLSGGGCSMVSGDTPTDPTLWMLVVLAIAGLLYRRRSRNAERRHP